VSAEDWARFADALVHELARLPLDTIVILSERRGSSRFVQFVQCAGYPPAGDHRLGYLRAEVSNGLAAPAAGEPTARGTRMLEALHWHPAAPNDTNWWRELTWPATTGEYAELVDAVVAVLRDLGRVIRPADLVYDAWMPSGRPWQVRIPGVEPENAEPVRPE
jgi:hypothetical protein